MDSGKAIRHMLDASGQSAYKAALAIGRKHSYISGMLLRGSDPSSAVLSDIARACGYSLQLVGHGETLPLDGTGKADAIGDDRADPPAR